MSSFSYFVGQRIKKYRKSRGYTIEQFSAMINKSKATLSKYENGAITIDIETLYEIAQALDIDLKCFIDYQPPMFHAPIALKALISKEPLEENDRLLGTIKLDKDDYHLLRYYNMMVVNRPAALSLQ